ncbi:MAG: hypothetical protein JST31_05360 [Actinobacteria bacterium]|nr:hypothetical protein [Actinomycetota bacterium]
MRSKTLAKVLGACGLALIAVAALVPAAQAAKPPPPNERFAGCPSVKENPKSLVCLRTEITGGYFQMGNKNVPITNPITLVGGVDENLGNFSYNAEGGMSKAKQKVPGGVIGLTGLTWLLEFLGSEALTLYAVTELAGTPDLNIFEEPLELPIKVHLVNGVLGNNCYIGTNANPIQLNLITGTTNPPAPNKPITGKSPEMKFEGPLTVFNNGTFVDNSFAAPGASGCVLTLFGFIPVNIDGAVNLQSGFPAAAGTNATAQNYNLEILESEIVYP